MSFDLKDLRDKLGTRQVVTVESCTGGLIASLLTSVPGSSAYFHGGYVTYANESKIALGVPAATIDQYGAVSSETALAMTAAVKDKDFVIAVTGIAGPSGATQTKPVGLVYIAINDQVREYRFTGDRDTVRAQAVDAALTWLDQLANKR